MQSETAVKKMEKDFHLLHFPICDLMGQNQSHVAIFYLEFNTSIYQFLGHIQCFKLVKTRSQYHVSVHSY